MKGKRETESETEEETEKELKEGERAAASWDVCVCVCVCLRARVCVRACRGSVRKRKKGERGVHRQENEIVRVKCAGAPRTLSLAHRPRMCSLPLGVVETDTPSTFGYFGQSGSPSSGLLGT